MQDLLSEIRRCQICRDHLPHGCRPVLQASEAEERTKQWLKGVERSKNWVEDEA